MKLPVFVLRPIFSLLDYWYVKLPLSLVAGALYPLVAPGGGEDPETVGEVAVILFEVDPVLLGMVGLALAADLLTGLGRVLLTEGIYGFDPDKFRSLGWKLAEYSAVVLVCVWAANGTAHTWAAEFFAPWNEAGFFYVFLTEGISTWQNVTKGKKGGRRLYLNLRDIWSGNWEEVAERKIDGQTEGQGQSSKAKNANANA